MALMHPEVIRATEQNRVGGVVRASLRTRDEMVEFQDGGVPTPAQNPTTANLTSPEATVESRLEGLGEAGRAASRRGIGHIGLLSGRPAPTAGPPA